MLTGFYTGDEGLQQHKERIRVESKRACLEVESGVPSIVETVVRSRIPQSNFCGRPRFSRWLIPEQGHTSPRAGVVKTAFIGQLQIMWGISIILNVKTTSWLKCPSRPFPTAFEWKRVPHSIFPVLTNINHGACAKHTSPRVFYS
jgi:hypothetical protein